MKLSLINFFLLIILFLSSSVYAKNYIEKYKISVSGINIGNLDWSLAVKDESYISKIYLKSSGILSAIYKFEGEYTSKGVFINNLFEAKEYKQYWNTKKKTKIVEMSFNDYLNRLEQKPDEKEHPRTQIFELYKYYDPITSFLNILIGNELAKTIDGRRTYIMKRLNDQTNNEYLIEISDYKNIWADHKRNDLQKIVFFPSENNIFPSKLIIFFKDRVFKLEQV